MITYDNHIINLAFQDSKTMSYYLNEHSNRYGKINILFSEGNKIIAKYADETGYIAARQSARWSKKKLNLLTGI
jgi:hypothetical protein